jgi:hypothetical protein
MHALLSTYNKESKKTTFSQANTSLPALPPRLPSQNTENSYVPILLGITFNLWRFKE